MQGRDCGKGDLAVDPVLAHPDPGAKLLAGAAPPRPALLALHDSRRLPEEIRALALTRRDHRQRLQRVARLDAGAADGLVALQRREPAVRRLPPRHPRTTTKYSPSNRTSPPPSSAA